MMMMMMILNADSLVQLEFGEDDSCYQWNAENVTIKTDVQTSSQGASMLSVLITLRFCGSTAWKALKYGSVGLFYIGQGTNGWEVLSVSTVEVLQL